MSPQPSDAPDTRARIVEAARYLFWKNGYNGTGLAELLERAHANSGSFYHFFDSKDALLRTVLDTYVSLLEPQVLQPIWKASADPIERIFVLLDGYRQRLHDTECQYGCPIGRLALEIDPENVPAHTLLAANFTAWKEAVEACLRADGIAQPSNVATLVLTVMEGAVMQARVYRSLEPFDACVAQLRWHLAALPRQRRRRRAAATVQRRTR